ncbi:MAG: hypothetical protein ABW360_17210 [Phenylobacterium sp.]
MVRRPPFLSDDLPMAEWHRRRNLQAAGLEPVALPGAPGVRLSDDLPMGEWQRIRNLQAQGRDEVLYGGQGDNGLTGGSGDDRLGSSATTAAGPKAAPAQAPLPDARRARALEYGAGRILNGLIPRGEGTDGANGYDMTYNNLDGKHYPAGWKKPTELSVDEAIRMKDDATRVAGDYAVGKYQFRARTLRQLKTWMKLSGSEIMTPEFQDRMGRELLHRRGYDDFLAGKIDAQKLQAQLAPEWDSLSDLNGHPYSDRKTLKKAPRISSAEIQATLEAAEAEFNQGIDEGRLPAPPGGWR